MKRNWIIFIALTFILTACGILQQANPTQSEAEMASQVAAILTSMPTATKPAAQPTAPQPTGPAVVTVLPQETPAYPAPPTETVITPGSTTAPTGTAVPSGTATATASPTATGTPSATAGPTFTPPPGDPKLRLGSPTWVDNFNDGRNWPLGEDQFTAVEVKDGALVMTGLTTTDGWRLSWPKVKNFYLEVTAKIGTCMGGDRYGAIVRVPDIQAANQGYLVGFTCDGRYSFRKWDGKTMTSLIPWTKGTPILVGSNQTNRIGLMAVDNRFILYANGTLLKEVSDSTFVQEGGFGLFVGANQTEKLSVSFDQVAYWENPTP